MSTGPLTAARRWAAICLSIVTVVILFFIGRRATNAATVPPSPSTSAIVDVTDGGSAETSDAPSDVPSIAPPPAVEPLPDGGIIVDLNVATESDLRKLPGVGPTRARKIVELRTHLGRFKSVDDLARIKGFGRATLRKLRPMTRASTP